MCAYARVGRMVRRYEDGRGKGDKRGSRRNRVRDRVGADIRGRRKVGG